MRTYGHNDRELIHGVAEAQKQAVELDTEEKTVSMHDGEVKLLPDEKELAEGIIAAKTEAEQETVIEKFLKGFKSNE